MPAASRDYRLPLLTAAAAAALGLAGCKVDSRPLLARDAPAPASAEGQALGEGYPYALGPLDPAEAAELAPVARPYDGYALAERAYAYDRVAWQAPPDYGFRYGEADPWAWQTSGDELIFAEPLDDGYRFYYYEPGEAYPYFVRDPRYGYAYGDNGALAAVFTAAGALLGADQLPGLAGVAGAYLDRGRDMRRVYYAQPRYALASDPVWYDRWEDRYPVLRSSWEPWMAAAGQHEPWRAYRSSTGERELRAFEKERERRAKAVEKLEKRHAKDEDKAFRRAAREAERPERREAHAPAFADNRPWDRGQGGGPGRAGEGRVGGDRGHAKRHEDGGGRGGEHRGGHGPGGDKGGGKDKGRD